MRGPILKLFLCMLIMLTACTQNLISGFTNLNGDAALYQDAQTQINGSNWDQAIKDIQAMSLGRQNGRDVMFTFATALAGKCGFQLMTFFAGLSNAWSGGGTPSAIFLTLLQAYQTGTINMAVTGAPNPPVATTDTYCSWSQQIMDNIQTKYGAWNADETTFVVFFSLAKVGMILKNTAGAGNTVNGGGKLIPDATFNACTLAVLPDFYATQITTGLALFLQYYTTIPFLASLNAAGVSLPTLLCGPVAGGNLGMNFCNHLTPATVTANDLNNVRGVITGSTATVGLNVLTVLDQVYVNHASNAGGGIWQCDGTAYTPPGAEGLLHCCP